MYIYISLYDIIGNSTNATELSTSQHDVPLPVVYGITVAGLVVLAVVIVVIAVVYRKRQKRPRTYTTFSKVITVLPWQYSIRG